MAKEIKKIKTVPRVNIYLSRKGEQITPADFDKLRQLGFDVVSATILPDVDPLMHTICRTNC